ncbi:MAG: hypothetical protein NW215_09095 [Hyphomicrobiales bacterium]|nr:hypothetical protein [Hyphomicrobiales bacterium]
MKTADGVEKRGKAAKARGDKPTPKASAKLADGALGDRSPKRVQAKSAEASELQTLRAENADLKQQLQAALARQDAILFVTADVMKRLDAVIASIRSMVKH